MGIPSKILMLIAVVAFWTVPDTAFAQLGNRPPQVAAPPQNAGGVQYASFEGELHFEHGVDPVCTALTNGVHTVHFAMRSGPNGIEAYMFGAQIQHAYIKGDRNHLSVTYLGDSAPSGTMRVQPMGTGYQGTVQSKTLVSAIYGACTASNAEFTVSRTNRDGQAAFNSDAQQFQLDLSTVEDLRAAEHGRINEALPRLLKAFKLKSQNYSPNHPQMLRYYYSLAKAYDDAGLYPYAAYWYQKAVTVCQQSFPPNDACHPITLLKLGQSLLANGDTRDAEPNIRAAIQAANGVFGPNAPVNWRGYNSLAYLLISTGRFAQVDPVLKQALVLGKQEGRNADTNAAQVKYTNAMLYLQTGQFQLAENTLRELIAHAEKAPGNEGVAWTIAPRLGLAKIMNLSGRSAAAEPIAKSALDAEGKLLGRERPNHPSLSSARVLVATIDMELGKTREAEDLLRQAVENDKQYLGPHHPSVAVAEMTLAKLLRTSGRGPDALSLLQDAYGISHHTDSAGLRWRVPGEFMQLYASGNTANPMLAAYYGKESVNELQRLRGNMSHSSSGTVESFSNTAEVKTIYKTLAHVLLENGRVSEAQQVLALLSVQEMDQFSRRSMLAGVSSGQAQGSIVAAPVGSSAVAPAAPSGPTAKPGAGTRGLMRGDSPQLAELTYSKSEQDLHRVNGEEIEIGQKLEALKQKQDEQGDLSPEDEKELQSLHAKYKSYMESFKDDESQMAKRSNDPHLKDEITGFSTSFQGTLKRVGHGAVAANYYIFDDVVDIILAVPNAPPIVRSYSVKTELLNQKIRDFNRKLSNDSQDPTPLARELYKVLIGPIDDDLEKAKAQTLMLVLHDELRYVPFAALNDGKRYLIERMAVVNVNMTAMDKLNEPQSVAWSAYGLGITKKGKTKTGREYDALTYAGKELSDVKNTLGGNSQIHTDEEFTEDMFQKGLQGKYPVIHIASHFDFEPGDINNSVLVLGDGATLSLADIQNGFMFTGVELLTLSACETGVGDGKAGADGSEVEGLGKIAQDNGAMAVIATLWPVVDESTGIFMSALYKAHQDHLTKAESLQKAQLTLLHGKFAHPRYWAPFILMGNWL